jgi:hypothetical protein
MYMMHPLEKIYILNLVFIQKLMIDHFEVMSFFTICHMELVLGNYLAFNCKMWSMTKEQL